MPSSLKPHFSRSLQGGGNRLHLAAHSHHLWPDVTFDAQVQAWNDAATFWDGKWAGVMERVIPEAQGHVARHLCLSDPASIVFAPNTHEFVLRLLSALPLGRVPRVLTTNSEFYSFARQVDRLEEDGLLMVDRVAVAPFADFPARFAAAAAKDGHDMVYFSHVFFNSGHVVPDLAALVRSVPDADTLVVIDGYHGFMARPTDFSAVEDRAFYLAGGYKYAMAGEGACFLACPPGYAKRPRSTGWYAAFGALADGRHGVPYGQGGARFWGATFDPSGIYRLNAAMRLLAKLQITTADIHARVRAMQTALTAALDTARLPGLGLGDLIVDETAPARANFLAYRSPHAAGHQARLAAAGIVTDLRADVLRIGLGLYHDPADMSGIAERIACALA